MRTEYVYTYPKIMYIQQSVQTTVRESIQKKLLLPNSKTKNNHIIVRWRSTLKRSDEIKTITVNENQIPAKQSVLWSK